MNVRQHLISGLLGLTALLSMGLLFRPEGDLSRSTLYFSKPEYRYFLEEWKKLGQEPGSFGIFGLPDHHRFWSESVTIGELLAGRLNPSIWSKDEIQDLSQYILLKSKEHRISPLLVVSVIEVESGFRPTAISPKGAVGLMQLMPATAAHLVAQMPERDWRGPMDLEDPKRNIELGLRYVNTLKTKFRRTEHVLTAYNMGPAALERKLRRGEQVSLTYYQKVMDAMQTYRRATRDDRVAARWKSAWL